MLWLAFSAWRRWSKELISQLEILGNVIIATVERKLAEKARRESEIRFQHLFQQAMTGIAIKNLTGQILFANPMLCSTLGYTEDELRGMDTSNFIDRENYPNELELFNQLHAGQIDNYKIEKRFTRKDGVKLWARLQVSRLKNSASSPLIIAMLEDITEQKRAHSQLEQLATRLIQVQDEERQRISRELHDDIGQRLGLLAVELADWKSASSTDRRSEERRHQELMKRVSELGKDIHELSHRLHSSQLEHLGLCAAVKNLVAQLSRQHSISITLKCDLETGSIPPEIALCLFPVTQEGPNNVIRHSKSQRASVDLRNDGGVVRLAITDEGVGFDASDQPQGIGLIRMRERLRIVGGTLHIRSQPGHGTQIASEVNAARPSATTGTAA